MKDPAQDYSVGLSEFFTKEFEGMGGKVVSSVSYNAKDSDFKPQLGQIKAAGAEIVVIPGYYGEVGTIARQAKEIGLTAPFLGGDGWDSEKLIEGGGGAGGALEGAYFTTHFAQSDPRPNVQKFVAAYKAKNGKAPAALVAQGYDAMMIVADAIKRAGSIERKKVRDALAATKNYDGMTGNITIDEGRDARKSAVVVQIKGAEFSAVSTVQPK